MIVKSSDVAIHNNKKWKGRKGRGGGRGLRCCYKRKIISSSLFGRTPRPDPGEAEAPRCGPSSLRLLIRTRLPLQSTWAAVPFVSSSLRDAITGCCPPYSTSSSRISLTTTTSTGVAVACVAAGGGDRCRLRSSRSSRRRSRSSALRWLLVASVPSRLNPEERRNVAARRAPRPGGGCDG